MSKPATIAAKMILVALFCANPWCTYAQESTKGLIQPETPGQVQEWPSTYRVDFLITELEEGKKINSRQYSMNLNGDDRETLKIGTRVPIEDHGQVTYIDVGTSIYCSIRERSGAGLLTNGRYMNGKLSMEVKADISNFAVLAVPEKPQDRSLMAPSLRQFQINGSTIAFPGTPIIIGSVDDPNSKRQFQLEVTAHKIR
jgi:hypothetical protein